MHANCYTRTRCAIRLQLLHRLDAPDDPCRVMIDAPMLPLPCLLKQYASCTPSACGRMLYSFGMLGKGAGSSSSLKSEDVCSTQQGMLGCFVRPRLCAAALYVYIAKGAITHGQDLRGVVCDAHAPYGLASWITATAALCCHCVQALRHHGRKLDEPELFV